MTPVDPPADTPDVDALYQLPLDQFTAARNALAKKTGGSGAAEIRALQKPSLVAWAVNQLYWQARQAYDHLVETAQETRAAQRDVLAGRSGDLRAAEARHRAAARAAFDRASSILSAGGHKLTKATSDALRRTLESLTGDEPAGRLTDELTPAGFEALAGLVPAGRTATGEESKTGGGGRETALRLAPFDSAHGAPPRHGQSRPEQGRGTTAARGPALAHGRQVEARTPRPESGRRGSARGDREAAAVERKAAAPPVTPRVSEAERQRQAKQQQEIFEATKAGRDAEREAARARAAVDAVSAKVDALRRMEAEAHQAWENVRARLEEAEKALGVERRRQEASNAAVEAARTRLEAARRTKA